MKLLKGYTLVVLVDFLKVFGTEEMGFRSGILSLSNAFTSVGSSFMVNMLMSNILGFRETGLDFKARYRINRPPTRIHFLANIVEHLASRP